MNNIPKWFYLAAGLALLWNLLGAAAVIMNFMITPEQLAALPIEQQEMYANTPKWASYASLLAVFTGALGCLALILKKGWAQLTFWISLGALCIQDIALFLIVDATAVVGVSVLIMQGLVALIAMALIYLSRHAKNQDWLS